MTTAIELLERRNAQLLDALEDMARQACYTRRIDDTEEPGITDSGALSTYAETLELLAEENRFRIVRGFGRMILGYWPENDPDKKAPC
jgi:hypothetical protein